MTKTKRGCELRSHSLPIIKHYPPTSWLDPRVEIRSSPIEGQGLFAREPIHAGEVVVVLGGRVIGDEELIRLGPHSRLAIGEGLNLMQEQDDLAQVRESLLRFEPLDGG